MIDQIIIGGKASFDDFGASLAKATKKPPLKKTIKETVPFSNITYDFTAMNGEIYWEERELEYIFEIVARTPEELEDMKTAFSAWVMNVINEDIHDPFIPFYHYRGTYEDMDFADEDDMEKTTATVIFKAYPYKIANVETVYEIPIDNDSLKMVSIPNPSSHRVMPTLIGDVMFEVLVNDEVISCNSAGVLKSPYFWLESGMNTFEIAGFGVGTVRICFFEEVF